MWTLYRLLLLSEACSVSTLTLPTLHFVLPAMHAAVLVHKGKEEGSPAAAVGSVLFQDKSSVDQDGPLLGLLTLWG